MITYILIGIAIGIALSPLIKRQHREWLEAIQSVDAGGDCNDRDHRTGR
jgi:hypothetical protein